MSISENIQFFRKTLPSNVSLVAVSKFHPVADLLEAYKAGQRIFGESRAQELLQKRNALPKDIEWHFIGQLQSNKVKDIAPFIHTIHSIDSLRLIEEVEKQAARHDRIIRILLEIHVAQEESKAGFTPGECRDLLLSVSPEDYPHVQIGGLMTMATNTDDAEQIRKEFRLLKSLFEDLKKTYLTNPGFDTLSMGMSADYKIAISEGSNMVRIGSTIFGIRE
jgi:pyridoxal phosphate enzyme, YggS family